MKKKQPMEKLLSAAKKRPILRFWREHILLKAETETKKLETKDVRVQVS